MKTVILGGRGFIGHHLARYLKNKGDWIRVVDWKCPTEFSYHSDEFRLLDLRNFEDCIEATKGMERVYALASDMGGVGYLADSRNQLSIFQNNTKIDMNSIEASRINGVKKLLYTSSACVYPIDLQNVEDAAPLKEEDAYPANPDGAYGWEKLYAEQICKTYRNAGMDTKIVRLQNVYGPECYWNNGREMAFAALCRKTIEAIRDKRDCIEVWGDGTQKRSYCYIDDVTKCLDMVMESDLGGPFNIGGKNQISLGELSEMIIEISGKPLRIKYTAEKPIGVKFRGSNNSMLREAIGYEPDTSIEKGLRKSYEWIESQIVGQIK